jgi:hypothetical protein
VDVQPGVEWSRIAFDGLGGNAAPFELWAARYVSDEGGADGILRRPAAELARGITGDEAGWHITTLMTNHDRGVEWHPFWVVALIDREERRATLFTHKEPPNAR